MKTQGNLHTTAVLRCLTGRGWEAWIDDQWVSFFALRDMSGPQVWAATRAHDAYIGITWECGHPAVNTEAGAVFVVATHLEVSTFKVECVDCMGRGRLLGCESCGRMA